MTASKTAFDKDIFKRAESTKKIADDAYEKFLTEVARVEAAWGKSSNTLGKVKMLWKRYGSTIKVVAAAATAGSAGSGGLLAWLSEPGTMGGIFSKLFGVG